LRRREWRSDTGAAETVHERKYVAEVDGRDHVELVETDEGWSPYLSLEDAYKLDAVRVDAVREALHRGDVESAARLSCVFRLTPVML
jgi:hypothetical protein